MEAKITPYWQELWVFWRYQRFVYSFERAPLIPEIACVHGCIYSFTKCLFICWGRGGGGMEKEKTRERNWENMVWSSLIGEKKKKPFCRLNIGVTGCFVAVVCLFSSTSFRGGNLPFGRNSVHVRKGVVGGFLLMKNRCVYLTTGWRGCFRRLGVAVEV